MSTQQMPPLLDRSSFYQTTLAHMAERFPVLEADAAETIFTIAMAYDALMGHFGRRLARYQLTVPGFNLLMVLNSPAYRESGCPMSALGDLLLVSKANITGIMDSLAKKELVWRVDAAYDRRIKLATITPQGQALLKRILPGHFQEVTRVLGALAPRERTQLRRHLGRLTNHIQQTGEASNAAAPHTAAR